jgi:hypothetical protein
VPVAYCVPVNKVTNLVNNVYARKRRLLATLEHGDAKINHIPVVIRKMRITENEISFAHPLYVKGICKNLQQ